MIVSNRFEGESHGFSFKRGKTFKRFKLFNALGDLNDLNGLNFGWQWVAFGEVER